MKIKREVCLWRSSSLTFTNQQLVVVNEANGALAPEAADHVNAHAIFTYSWDLPAFIDV